PERHALPLHDALPIWASEHASPAGAAQPATHPAPLAVEPARGTSADNPHIVDQAAHPSADRLAGRPSRHTRSPAPCPAKADLQRSEEHTSELQSRENL